MRFIQNETVTKDRKEKQKHIPQRYIKFLKLTTTKDLEDCEALSLANIEGLSGTITFTCSER